MRPCATMMVAITDVQELYRLSLQSCLPITHALRTKTAVHCVKVRVHPSNVPPARVLRRARAGATCGSTARSQVRGGTRGAAHACVRACTWGAGGRGRGSGQMTLLLQQSISSPFRLPQRPSPSCRTRPHALSPPARRRRAPEAHRQVQPAARRLLLLPAVHTGGRPRHQPGHRGHGHHLRQRLEPAPGPAGAGAS